MGVPARQVLDLSAPIRRRAYDPNNLSPGDAEDRKQDDTSEGIDWDEIIATTQDDWNVGRFAFNSDDYADHATAMAALRQKMESIMQGVLSRVASSTPRFNATRL